jgi:two-component system chemotaxis response regulator CheB
MALDLPLARERNPYFVAVGASGSEGLHDLKGLLAAFPADLQAVVLVVLHRPSDKVSHLREILARKSALPVLVPDDDDEFHIGACYIGEPDAHLALAERSRVNLIEGGKHEHRNETVDLLFTSVAAHARERGFGVVLSGSLSDGSRGLAAIHFMGGKTMVLGKGGEPAQGMPKNATDYDGPIDYTGHVDEIAGEIARQVRLGEPAS